jgi:hypothetical protein
MLGPVGLSGRSGRVRDVKVAIQPVSFCGIDPMPRVAQAPAVRRKHPTRRRLGAQVEW